MSTKTVQQTNTGISEGGRLKVAEGLSKLLADTYTLYLKTHKFHWNVTGPQFQTLHALFEKEYTELALAVDEIAERIRAVGHLSPGSYREFAALTSIQEEENELNANEMLQSLLEGNEAVVRTARSILPSIEEAKDEVSVDLLVGRMKIHEKEAWMLRSLAS